MFVYVHMTQAAVLYRSLLLSTPIVRNEIGVAPGLSVSIDVEFLTRKANDFVDKLVITAEDSQ